MTGAGGCVSAAEGTTCGGEPPWPGVSMLLILAGVATMPVARGHRPADITPRRDRHASTE